jgi:hypothetical protein
MLTSITPLGERGRGSRWWLTFAFMLIGSAAGGALLGALLGALGQISIGPPGDGPGRLYALGALLALGFVSELGVGGLHFPTVRRQVDERWLRAYRGWVYGLGFGFQLGAGVITVVSTTAVYVTFAACLLVGDVWLGLAIGGTFGTVRAATLIAAARVTDTSALLALGARLQRWAPRARRLALAGELGLAIVAVAAAVAVG